MFCSRIWVLLFKQYICISFRKCFVSHQKIVTAWKKQFGTGGQQTFWKKNPALCTETQPKSGYPAIKRSGSIVSLQLRDDFMLDNRSKNSWFLSNRNELVHMTSASINKNSEIVIHGREVSEKHAFFVKPIRSSYLNIYVSNISYLKDEKSYTSNDFFYKLVAINYKCNDVVFIPLQHTLPKAP